MTISLQIAAIRAMYDNRLVEVQEGDTIFLHVTDEDGQYTGAKWCLTDIESSHWYMTWDDKH